MLIDTHCHLDFPDFAPEGRDRRARRGSRRRAFDHHLDRIVEQFDRVHAMAEAYTTMCSAPSARIPITRMRSASRRVEVAVALARAPEMRRAG